MAIATTNEENIPSVDNAHPDNSNDPMLIRRHISNTNTNDTSGHDQPSSSSDVAVANQIVAPEQIQSQNTFSLEFPVLLLFFSWNLSGTVFQNQVLYQTCMLTYNYSVCSRLTDEEIDEVMPKRNRNISQHPRNSCAQFLKKKKTWKNCLYSTGSRGEIRNVCIKNLYGPSGFGKHYSSVYKRTNWTMVG